MVNLQLKRQRSNRRDVLKNPGPTTLEPENVSENVPNTNTEELNANGPDETSAAGETTEQQIQMKEIQREELGLQRRYQEVLP